ncbi:tRNA/rRNA methyltransferase SpoU [Nitritalea halalkaliphila LW7]|uniref:tRNA/rRNA methyltransferase SpoU n=1 Tax=Nitritalea halalkaliphila LW7 TaxID=1189621 RepID=I5C167_9BACT|nr:RNA methyltransferase [Nitritalea halalkaliphila]EIM75569.1 tRNA/rRNA methyltransferase SpoU [Nitritalea halalkaliphila LW7]
MKKLTLDELQRLSPDAYREAEKTPICLLLNDIRSLNNVGSAFRTADAFRLEKIYLCGITGRPPHRDIHKTALGATETVDWEYVEDAEACVKKLREDGYEIAALEQVEKSTPLQDFQPNAEKHLVLVVGNEVFGVSQALVDTADYVLEIPQFGTKHSLNVSVSLGIAVWDIFSKLNFRSKGWEQSAL